MGLGLIAAVTLAMPTSIHAQRGIGVQQDQGDQRKIALVIGNGGYDTAPLRNPPNDARDMARTLRDLGFDVIHRRDADQVEMKRAVREFGERIRRADVALFYYAGHGVQAQGRNYLIPVGAVINSEPEVEYESVDAGFIIAQMEAAGSPLNIVILDACRNNPFARSFRSASRGLTQVTAPTGTLIAYATAPGSVASDGDGENGLYTQELLRFMRTPGLSVEEVFKQVRISLNQRTDGEQTPWESSSLVGDFYFAPPEPEPEPEPAAESEPTPTQPPAAETDAAEREADEEEPEALPAPTSLPTAEDFADHYDACLDPLTRKDIRLFARRYATTPVDVQTVIQTWLVDSTRGEVQRVRDLPGIDIFADGRKAASNVMARFSWRSGFGVNRTADIPIETVIRYEADGWVLDRCRVAGPVEELR